MSGRHGTILFRTGAPGIWITKISGAAVPVRVLFLAPTLALAPAAAKAGICTDDINTSWAVSDDTVFEQETGFAARSTSSSLRGQGGLRNPDSYSLSVSALDNYILQLLASIEDVNGAGGDSPQVTFEPTDVDRVGVSGSIIAVHLPKPQPLALFMVCLAGGAGINALRAARGYPTVRT